MEDYRASDVPEDAAVNRLGPTLAPDGTLARMYIYFPSVQHPIRSPAGTGRAIGRFRISLEEITNRKRIGCKKDTFIP